MNKQAFATVLLLAALAGGWMLANVLVLRFLDLPHALLDWNTWWQYVRAMNVPQMAPYTDTIRYAVATGFGLPLLVWTGLLVPLQRRPREALHGDARFATLSDLKKAGLLKQTPQSILIGSYKGRYLWLGGAQHVITISPTRSGKTTSIAIPVLLSYQHSMVVLDLKGELFKPPADGAMRRGMPSASGRPTTSRAARTDSIR